MTECTLREKIASLPRYEPDHCDRMGSRSDMIEEPEGDWLSREAVLAILDAHTAAQPAPDAVADARRPVFDILRSYDHPGEANYRKGRLMFNFIDMAGEHRGQIAMTQDERDAVGGIMFALAKGSRP